MAGLDDPDKMRDFVERYGLEAFPHAIDPDGAIWQRFGSITRSAFVFVDADGTTTATDYGVLGEAELEARIDDLVAS